MVRNRTWGHTFAPAALAAAAVAAWGCSPRRNSEPPAQAHHVEVVEGSVVVKSGSVGHGSWQSHATYVLVDVRNTGPSELDVTLAGDLLAAGDHPVGALRPQSLRIPPGGMRMFALVDGEDTARPEAQTARIDVVGASVAEYPLPVVVTHGRVDMDQGRAVVQGYVENTSQWQIEVVAIAGFYDGAGRPVSRPFSRYLIDAGQRRGAMFVGPNGSDKAYLFVGEYVFCEPVRPPSACVSLPTPRETP